MNYVLWRYAHLLEILTPFLFSLSSSPMNLEILSKLIIQLKQFVIATFLNIISWNFVVDKDIMNT
mgnify:CR=1 FL=1